MKKYLLLIFLVFTAAACSRHNIRPSVEEAVPKTTQNCDCKQQPATILNTVTIPDSGISTTDNKPIITPDYALLKAAKWTDIDGFSGDDLSAAWPAWLKSCNTLVNKLSWQKACNAASTLNKPNKLAIQTYFKQYFNAYSANNQDGSDTGLITGYYEPKLQGSRTKSAQYPYPLYRQPTDLVTVELGEIYPELKNKRVRGKISIDKDGHNKLLPYLSRAEIEASPSPLQGNELVWINDIIDGFFLQIQGSGLISLENNEQIQLGYADQNGQAYNSIGRILIEQGELSADLASMQGIKNWARNNPNKLRDLLNANPSYVFFRELPAGLPGPLGALGVPITAERSVAIDPKFVPLGAPVFLSTTQPNTIKPLKRLMVAQDTGGAIKGGVRADFFWGAGNEAGKLAGAMKQAGKIWVLLPKEFQLPN